MKSLIRIFQTLVSFSLAYGAQGQWSDFVQRDPSAWDRKISTEGFQRDQDIGIEFFTDPEHLRKIGARNFHIWHTASNDYKFYLRVAASVQALEVYPFAFQPPAEVPPPDLERNIDPYFIDEFAETSKYDRWDAWYHRHGGGSGARYLSRSASDYREFLLKTRYGIEANFVHRNEVGALMMFVLKSAFSEGSDFNESVGFVFDSDPFGFAYRVPQRDRVAQRLADFQNRSFYQWVRVGNGEVLYGDIHEFELPRPVYVGIIGDSYTSGEAAPLNGDPNLRGHGLENWITEYANYGDRLSHRSIASGWEKAVSQQTRQKFALVSIDHSNVSSSGAVARKYQPKHFVEPGCFSDDVTNNPRSGEIMEDNRVRLSGNTLQGSIDTAARQLYILDELLERSGSQTLDVLGFTFGGNDAFFGAIIETLLLEDYQDYDDSSIEGIVRRIGTGAGFDHINPNVVSLDDILQVGLDNLEVLGNRLQGDHFGFQTHQIIRGNYCNPVGTIRNYSPDGVPRATAEIVGREMNFIRLHALPMMNDDLVGYDAQRFGYTLADTRRPTSESPGLPVRHSYHILADSDERYFEPMLVIAEDLRCVSSSRELFPYAFHPNVKGHDKIYRPIYNEKLEDALRPEIREEIYASEYGGPDIIFGNEGVYYRDGKLELDIGAINVGEAASSPCFVELSVQFGIGEESLHTPVATRARSEFSVPLTDVSGQRVGFPSLEQSFGRGTRQTVILEEGELECAYYNFLIRHFLSLADQDFIREQIGFIEPNRLFARFASFIPLFRDQINFRFRLVPESGIPEFNMRNNEGFLTYELPFEVSLESFFKWIGKTRDQYYEELWDKMVGYGIKPEQLTNADFSDLYGNPDRVQDLFDSTRVAHVTYDREELTDGDTMSQSAFSETATLVEESLRKGMFSEKPLVFEPDLIQDYLVFETSFGQKVIGFDRWAEIPYILPQDGGTYNCRYCKYDRSAGQDKASRYTDISIKVTTPQKFDGLRGIHAGNVVNQGILQLDVDFAPRPGTLSSYSRVTVRDLASGGALLDYVHQPETEPQEIDLNSYLFHSQRVSVDVEGLGLGEVNSYFVDYENASFISQEAVQRDGAYVDFLLTIHGPFSDLLGDDIVISLSSPQILGNVSDIRDFLLEVELSPQQAEGETARTFKVRMPVELVYGESKLIQISNRFDPDISKFSSINCSALRPLVPSEFTPLSFNGGFESSVDSDLITFSFPSRVGEVYSIEQSADLVNWSTIESDIAGTGDIIRRQYGANGQTMYYRAGRHE